MNIVYVHWSLYGLAPRYAKECQCFHVNTDFCYSRFNRFVKHSSLDVVDSPFCKEHSAKKGNCNNISLLRENTCFLNCKLCEGVVSKRCFCGTIDFLFGCGS